MQHLINEAVHFGSALVEKRDLFCKGVVEEPFLSFFSIISGYTVYISKKSLTMMS